MPRLQSEKLRHKRHCRQKCSQNWMGHLHFCPAPSLHWTNSLLRSWGAEDGGGDELGCWIREAPGSVHTRDLAQVLLSPLTSPP